MKKDKYNLFNQLNYLNKIKKNNKKMNIIKLRGVFQV